MGFLTSGTGMFLWGQERVNHIQARLRAERYQELRIRVCCRQTHFLIHGLFLIDYFCLGYGHLTVEQLPLTPSFILLEQRYMSTGMAVRSSKIVAALLRAMGASICFLVAIKKHWHGGGKA
jgi:hypothetical protein